MKNKRREFIRNLSITGIAALSSPSVFSRFKSTSTLKVLVLGGTNFLGPAIVQSLLNGGHDVSLFNRGITNPHLFPNLKKIKGDREKGILGYSDLRSARENWDVVIDVWPQNPHFVKDAIDMVKKRTSHYVFISSIAVYNNYVKVGMDESSPRRKGTNYEPGNYNLNKVLCEKRVEEEFPNNFTILRPGAIVGDRDSGPFGTYVLNRIMNRNEMLAPDGNDPVQLIDAKDIGNFVNNCIVNNKRGYFNLVGPATKMGYKEMIIGAKEALNSRVKILWMDKEFLTSEMKLEPFMQIPLWIPVASDPEPGFYQISNARAIKAGLTFTNYRETVKISYDSFKARRFIPEKGSELIFGISDQREREIIKKWKRRS